MHVNLNTNINQSRPNFKASFANTPETKDALKTITKEDPNGVLQAIEALDQSSSKDVFSVTQGNNYSEFNIVNETLAEGARGKIVKYDKYKNSFFDKIVNMVVSEDKYNTVGTNLPQHFEGWDRHYDIDWKKGETIKFNKQTNANFILEQMGDSRRQIKRIDNQIKQLEEQIERLEDKKTFFIKKEDNLLKHYAEGVINSLYNRF